MLDGDYVCRSALYPRFLTHGVFDDAALLSLTSSDDKLTYALSVASRFLLRDENGAHDYGIKAAKVANRGLTSRLGREPEPLTEKVHYLGFYDLKCGDIRSLKLTNYRLMVRWQPENDIDEHFQVEFVRRKSDASKKELRNERLGALSVMATFLTGPFRGIDPDDMHLSRELNEIELVQHDGPGSINAD